MSSAGAFRSNLQLYRRLLSYAWPYKWLFLAATLSMAVTSATEAGFASMMKPLVNAGLGGIDAQKLKHFPTIIIGLFLLRGLTGFLANYGMQWIGRKVVFHLRADLFARMVHLPSSYFDSQSSGILIAKVIYDVEQVMSATTKAISVLVKDNLSVLFLLGWMIYLSWKLTVAFAVLAPLLALAMRLIGRRFRKTSRMIQQSMGDITHTVQEAIEGQRVVKIFGAQSVEIAGFHEVNRRNNRQALKKAAVAALNVPVIELLAAFGIAAVVQLAIKESTRGALDAGTFVSYLTAMMLLLPAIRRLSAVSETVQTGLAAAQSVFSVMDQPPEPDPARAELASVHGRIEYRGVSFRYPTSAQSVLRDISLTVEPGQTVALVGASGSGKTTIANLLPRFYMVEQGAILLDDTDINSLRLNNLRSHIALVSQETVLFDDTIRNNIAYGRLGPADDEQIVEAARAAHVLDFTERLPEGLDTMVGERGMRMSGGQRQRIAIARALYKNAPILILDEATSALDAESERYVQDAMQRLMKDRSTLVIAHRLSTIENAHRIVVLERGEIVESGTHRELLARNGAYARLHRIQFDDRSA